MSVGTLADSNDGSWKNRRIYLVNARRSRRCWPAYLRLFSWWVTAKYLVLVLCGSGGKLVMRWTPLSSIPVYTDMTCMCNRRSQLPPPRVKSVGRFLTVWILVLIMHRGSFGNSCDSYSPCKAVYPIWIRLCNFSNAPNWKLKRLRPWSPGLTEQRIRVQEKKKWRPLNKNRVFYGWSPKCITKSSQIQRDPYDKNRAMCVHKITNISRN